MKRMVVGFVLLLAAGCALVGCVYDKGIDYSNLTAEDLDKGVRDFEFGTEDQNRYIEFVRGVAKVPRPEGAPEGWYTEIPDRNLYPFGGVSTGHECHRVYKLVYADRRHISFRCEERSYPSETVGGPLWNFTVGTIDRETGKILTLDDVDAFSDREALGKRLRDAAFAQFHYDSLPEVRPINNFCLMEDGWHFVYDMGWVCDICPEPFDVVIGK